MTMADNDFVDLFQVDVQGFDIVCYGDTQSRVKQDVRFIGFDQYAESVFREDTGTPGRVFAECSYLYRHFSLPIF
jgi:hypothetical protein